MGINRSKSNTTWSNLTQPVFPYDEPVAMTFIVYLIILRPWTKFFWNCTRRLDDGFCHL